MNPNATILIVDDTENNVVLLTEILKNSGYQTIGASSGVDALSIIKEDEPDLVLLDVMMPNMNGYEVCRIIRQELNNSVLPVVMVTALQPSEERIKGLEAGADDFLTKPINQAELCARVKSLLRIKHLFSTVQKQADELDLLNKNLEQQVEKQVAEIERLNRLRRFLSPQVAELVVASKKNSILNSHRREVSIVFIDLRGFTAFSEQAEPEETIDFLKEYHEAMGDLILQYKGTVDHIAGDGCMVFFNDPIQIEAPAFIAAQMAMEMHTRMKQLLKHWRKKGYALGFGVGIALGYATLGIVGIAWRQEYSANGPSVNLASRLCDEAKDGQTLVTQRVFAEIESHAVAECLRDISIKGIDRPMTIYNIKTIDKTSITS